MIRRLLIPVTIIALVAIGGSACAPMPSPTPVPSKPAPTVTPAATPVAPPSPAVPSQPPALGTPIVKETLMNLTWLGHATFILNTGTGLTALLDPMGPGVGYPLAPVQGIDLVTISHEHNDHNNVGLAVGNPQVLRGLAGADWARVDTTVKGTRVRTVGTYHDDSQGSQRGKNAIFVFEMEGLRLAHLGDLGHKLTPEQVKAIGPVEVVLIPVGGFYTIDGRTAAAVIEQLQPRVAIPMHYKTPDLAQSLAQRLATVDDFIAALPSAAVVQAERTITISAGKLPSRLTIMVMRYK